MPELLRKKITELQILHCLLAKDDSDIAYQLGSIKCCGLQVLASGMLK